VSDTPQTLFALLTPSNNSGALAFASVSLDGATLRVDAVGSNFTPDRTHPFHIHGFTDDRPSREGEAVDDRDGDGFAETPEASATAYGPVLVNLTAAGPSGDYLGAASAFPVADAAGRIAFSQTYRFDPADSTEAGILERLSARFEGRHLQFHGLDLPPGLGDGTPNEVNGTVGYVAGVPAAGGVLVGLPGGVGTSAEALATLDPGLLSAAVAALAARLDPYTLNTEGTGPIAPEPAGVPDAPAVQTFASLLLPSNNSGVVGAATVVFDEAAGTVSVDLVARGLTPGREHPLHIHGFADDRPSLLPNYRLDADTDGFVEDQEGEAVVGPVILALTTDGTVSDAAVVDDFPFADENGVLALRQTYRFDLSDAGEEARFEDLRDRMTGRELQIHGLEVSDLQGEGTRGEVDGIPGYKAGLPVANGIVLPVEELDGLLAAGVGDLVRAVLQGDGEAGLASEHHPFGA
jgi:Cu/Zn superoxide dismutase